MEGRGGARALLSGDERLGRGGARALRGVSGLRAARGGVLGLGGAAAASSELWLCMTASSSSSSTWRHLSKMEGILSMRYRLRSWQAGGPYLRARPLLKQPGRLDFAEHELPPRNPSAGGLRPRICVPGLPERRQTRLSASVL